MAPRRGTAVGVTMSATIAHAAAATGKPSVTARSAGQPRRPLNQGVSTIALPTTRSQAVARKQDATRRDLSGSRVRSVGRSTTLSMATLLHEPRGEAASGVMLHARDQV